MKVARVSEEVTSPADTFDRNSRFVVEGEKILVEVIVLLPREASSKIDALLDWGLGGGCPVEDKKTVEVSEDVKLDPILAWLVLVYTFRGPLETRTLAEESRDLVGDMVADLAVDGVDWEGDDEILLEMEAPRG